jgi:hypothetical protein
MIARISHSSAEPTGDGCRARMIMSNRARPRSRSCQSRTDGRAAPPGGGPLAGLGRASHASAPRPSSAAASALRALVGARRARSFSGGRSCWPAGARALQGHAAVPTIRARRATVVIADAVRYMSVDSRKWPDSQGRGGTTTAGSTTARTGEHPQTTGRFRWWWQVLWQVLASNQRRLSRRFYRPLVLIWLYSS